MRRAHAILAIMALLAAPLALVGRSFAAAAADCNGYCCLPHGKHARHSQHQSSKLAGDGMQCRHGEGGHAMNCCSMRSGRAGLDFGLLAPLVPATPSQIDRIAAPPASRHAFTFSRVIPAFGFLSAPFEPPRA